jgi:hypothetical protein
MGTSQCNRFLIQFIAFSIKKIEFIKNWDKSNIVNNIIYISISKDE